MIGVGGKKKTFEFDLFIRIYRQQVTFHCLCKSRSSSNNFLPSSDCHCLFQGFYSRCRHCHISIITAIFTIYWTDETFSTKLQSMTMHHKQVNTSGISTFSNTLTLSLKDALVLSKAASSCKMKLTITMEHKL